MEKKKNLSKAKLKAGDRRKENISQLSGDILINRLLEPYLESENEFLKEIISTEKIINRKYKPKKGIK
ncbi:MAG TPA: hypothetical protein VG961_07355 [Ignavibacteria bacterium]|nr:hypothetical protein [Ignavibacteria bacterium]